jgi:hypothetical protein
MEDPEAYLRAIAAPLARVREGSPYPVARLSLEAVANAFVVLGLLPAARAEEIFIAQQPVLEAAGFRDIRQFKAGESDDPVLKYIESREKWNVADINAYEAMVFEGVR